MATSGTPAPAGGQQTAPAGGQQTAPAGGQQPADTGDQKTVVVPAKEAPQDLIDSRREARAKSAALKEEVRQLNEKLAHFKEQDAAAQRSKDIEAGNFEKVEAELRGQLDASGSTVSDLRKELEVMKTAGRRDSFLDAIMTKSGVSNRTAMGAMLVHVNGIDTAPENFSDADVKQAIKGLTEVIPEVMSPSSDRDRFRTSTAGENDRDSPEYWKGIGASHVHGGMPDAYATLTGRKK